MAAFTGGVVAFLLLTPRSEPPGDRTSLATNQARADVTQPHEYEIDVRSIPDEAEIWRLEDNKLLGQTPARLKVSLSDKPVSFVFKRKGYGDETRQVGTPYPILVVLKPALPTVK